jgi:hypothetical protein
MQVYMQHASWLAARLTIVHFILFLLCHMCNILNCHAVFTLF